MKLQIYLLAIIATVALYSCGDGTEKEKEHRETVSINHLLGTVEVPKNPERVVVLDYSALENLDYLGVKPVGVPKQHLPAHLSQYRNDEAVTDVGSIHEPNLELINELQPDLIIIGTRLAERYDTLSEIAPVLYPYPVMSENMLESFKTSLEEYGLIFDKEEELKEAYSQIEKRINEVRTQIEAGGKRALILLHNQGRFSAYGSGSRFGIIHDVLGYKEASKGLDTHVHGNPVSNEFIQSTNPDVIFIVDRSSIVGDYEIDKNSIVNQLVQQTNAARNNQIYYLNPEVWYLAGGGITSVKMMIEEVAQSL